MNELAQPVGRELGSGKSHQVSEEFKMGTPQSGARTQGGGAEGTAALDWVLLLALPAA